MTSIEIAMIVGIVLIIAVAVGWYLYTTVVASATGQPRLEVTYAELNGTTTGNPRLYLIVTNAGPVDLQIDRVEIGGRLYTLTCTPVRGPPPSSPTGGVIVLRVGATAACRTDTLTGFHATPGTMLPGRVILSGGQSFPFNAVVRP
jgi:hypothetical protein